MIDGSLRVALLTYRGSPSCGGQGVYVRNLARELGALGHRVEVIAGQPYPDLDDGCTLTRLPSLDLYRPTDPFRVPRRGEYRDLIDVLEVATMLTGGFPEPLTFSLRAWRHLRARRRDFDIVHDNQSLGYGSLGLMRLGPPLVTTIHHPVQVDRAIELAAAGPVRRLTLRRWYGFTRMQRRVARRLPHVITVSSASAAEISEQLGVATERVHVVALGTDPAVFSPGPDTARQAGRIVTTASADVPLKGLLTLIEALAKVRTERAAQLVVIGSARPGGAVHSAIERHGLCGAVRFTGRIDTAAVVHELRSAQVAVVPSLFEGFCLPAVEAMACGTPLVSTTAGALPEVVGPDGVAALLVPPGDPEALASALGTILDEPILRRRLAGAGRARVLARFTWRRAAEATVGHYRSALVAHGQPQC